ncbi:MAG: hypothetical protein ACRDD7_06045 [Peptostreptococcaceae bacterium]
MQKNKNFKRQIENLNLAEGLEFVLGENFDINNMTPDQKSQILKVCKGESYDYLALASLISAIINNYTKTLEDIDIIVAILNSIISDLLLVRTIRLNCESNIKNTSQGKDPTSTLAPGVLFGIDETELAFSRKSDNGLNHSNNKKGVRKVKKIKKIKKVKKKV